MLYRFCVVLLFLLGSSPLSFAQSYAIHASNAVFYPAPVFLTNSAVIVKNPAGPFLLDWDKDGVLEADVNGNGHDAKDPKLKDYDGDGSRELPPGAVFTGELEFTSFYIPEDVQIVTTGPLTIRASREVAVFGVMKLKSGASISTTTNRIELRTSAWLSEDGSPITFVTGMSNAVVTDLAKLAQTNSVPPILFTTLAWDNDDFRTILGLVPPQTNEFGGILETNWTLYFRTRRDMRYQVFSKTDTPAPPGIWTELTTTDPIAGDGFPSLWPVATNAQARFFRLQVHPVD